MLKIDNFGIEVHPTHLLIGPRSLYHTYEGGITSFHVKKDILGTYEASIRNSHLTLQIYCKENTLSTEIVLSGISTGYILMKRNNCQYMDTLERTVFTKRVNIDYISAKYVLEDPKLFGLSLIRAVGRTQNYSLLSYNVIEKLLDYILNKTHMCAAERIAIEQLLLNPTLVSIVNNTNRAIRKLIDGGICD